MKRLLLASLAGLALSAGSASAADLGVPYYKAPPPPPVYNWTGFYLGLNGGYGLADDPFSQTLSAAGITASSSINSRVDPNGGIFGGQIGYNYQFGHVVASVEGDFQWSGQRDTAGCGIECINEPGVITATVGSVEQSIKWFGTARGRLGWADDGWLLYITGGGAWARIDTTAAISESEVGLSFAQSETTSSTKGGWVFGGGTEVRIFGPWSAKFEYLYMDLGHISNTAAITAFGSAVETVTTNSTVHDNIIRAGLNYKFN